MYHLSVHLNDHLDVHIRAFNKFSNTKINNPLSSISIYKVVDGNGSDVTSDWRIIKATSGSSGTSPTFKIQNLKQQLINNEKRKLRINKKHKINPKFLKYHREKYFEITLKSSK